MVYTKGSEKAQMSVSKELNFIDMFINNHPVSRVLPYLLKDQTTGKNIVWATNTYSKFGTCYHANRQMFPDFNIQLILDGRLLPRVQKPKETQAARTKSKAEVFTPSQLCNKMNNHCDNEWFGRDGVFNTEVGQTQAVNTHPVEFNKPGDWRKYIDSTHIEITCGEAPYLVSRYDAVTGQIIPVKERIGILDRKLRIVNENTDNEAMWLRWAARAYQATYGFEYQGDNLFFARVNLVQTFIEYYEDRFGKKPNIRSVKKIAEIVSWNIWQMDGLKYTEPYGIPEDDFVQMNLFDQEQKKPENGPAYSVIKDWKTGKNIEFKNVKGDVEK